MKEVVSLLLQHTYFDILFKVLLSTTTSIVLNEKKVHHSYVGRHGDFEILSKTSPSTPTTPKK